MSDQPASSRSKLKQTLVFVVVAVLLVGVTVGLYTSGVLFPQTKDAKDDHPADENDGASIVLGRQARKNIGLRLETIKLKSFQRTVTIPGMIVEIPGRSHLQIIAPFTGVVTHIYPIQGQSVAPGDKLFEIRLTHEELVQAQSEFLRVTEQLDVERREVARLEEVARDGGLAGRTLLQHTYELKKLEADLRARGQGLELHGLSKQQVAAIRSTRILLENLLVTAPLADGPMAIRPHDDRWQVDTIQVELGQHVAIGQPLAVLSDYAELYIEGKAFDQDADSLFAARKNGWDVTAVLANHGIAPREIPGLQILYVANSVEEDTRALHFYLKLHNEPINAPPSAVALPSASREFISWQYRPGQRVQLKIPVDLWEKQIVLPIDAVVQDGAEFYVYQPAGDHLKRRPVHVLYSDRYQAVIANDGSIYDGEKVAVTGAYMVHLAIKKKAGEGGGGHGHAH